MIVRVLYAYEDVCLKTNKTRFLIYAVSAEGKECIATLHFGAMSREDQLKEVTEYMDNLELPDCVYRVIIPYSEQNR